MSGHLISAVVAGDAKRSLDDEDDWDEMDSDDRIGMRSARSYLMEAIGEIRGDGTSDHEEKEMANNCMSPRKCWRVDCRQWGWGETPCRVGIENWVAAV